MPKVHSLKLGLLVNVVQTLGATSRASSLAGPFSAESLKQPVRSKATNASAYFSAGEAFQIAEAIEPLSVQARYHGPGQL